MLIGTLTSTFTIQSVEPSGDFGAQSSVDWWPMFRHDLSHSGYSTSTGPSTNRTIWNYRTGGNVQSSPAVADGKVYVGSDDDKVYCLDALTGTKIWSYTTGGAVVSSPAVAGGRVYVGSGDRNVYCLNASTGTKIWSYTAGSAVYSSPAVADGKAYVGSVDHKLYAFGPPPNYTLTITATAGGTTNPSPGAYTYVDDSSVEVTAIPDAYYMLDHWELDGANVGSSNPYTVHMDDNHTLHAIFISLGIHDVAVTDVTPSKTVVGQGYSMNINITVENQGDFPETFNVTLYYNSNVINHTTVTNLPPGENTTITFSWNTAGVAKGNYTISAYATPVQGETDTTDNTFIDGIVWVKWPYDVTGDNYCGIDDIVEVAEHFGTEPGGPPNSHGYYYDPIYDINCDDYVGIDDIVEIAEHFGEEDP